MGSLDAAGQARQSERGILGRESESSILLERLGRGRAGALVIVGEAGLGKTTLWEAFCHAARERGFRVLSARASVAETRLSYAGLIDLLESVDREELASLPAPQLHALEVALLRAEPVGTPPDSAVALGLLNAVRALAERPLLVAVDDVPWLDTASAEALAFAARRLDGDGPMFVLTRRPGPASTLEQAFSGGLVDRLELGPLSYGAIRRLLAARLGLVLPRHVLRRLVDATLGNPLFALEVAGELDERGLPELEDDLPLPDTVEDLLGTRVARLPAPTRRLLLATALSADLSFAQLGAIAGAEAAEDAVENGVLVLDGGRVRASHPLLAAAVKKRARAPARRELHGALAGVLTDEVLRARHLALATDVPDELLARTVAAASVAAAARGAAREAAELAAHALRLTPAGSAARSERLLAAAACLDQAGEAHKVTDLIAPELDALPWGAARVRAHLLLSEGGGVKSVGDHQRHLEAALREAGDDPSLRAPVLAKQSIHATAACVERVQEAEAWALEALVGADAVGAETVGLALHGLAWARALSGRPIDDLVDRFRAECGSRSHLVDSVDRVAALRLTWRGETAAARTALTSLLALADERGELWSYVVLRLHLCELELRVGNWDEATRLLDEWAESAEAELLVPSSYQRSRALLAAGRGQPDEVERWAVPALDGAESTGARWHLLETLRARGVAALLAQDPDRALESLRAVWEHTQREGIDDPGALAVAPDLVEALVASGDPAEARKVTDRLRALAVHQEHPWGLAAAKRCEGLVSLAGKSYDEEAAAALGWAADDYEKRGLRFDAARALLALGRGQRRHRKWAAARASLEGAAADFDEIGSPGWAEAARSELARVGARRPPVAGQLTPTEQRVVDLAAEGLSNKEIAQALVVTVNTVETHLSHAYAKLGVRSRAQLSRARGPEQ